MWIVDLNDRLQCLSFSHVFSVSGYVTAPKLSDKESRKNNFQSHNKLAFFLAKSVKHNAAFMCHIS